MQIRREYTPWDMSVLWLVSEWWNVWYWSTDVKLLIGILLISDATRYIAFFNLVCKRKLVFFYTHVLSETDKLIGCLLSEPFATRPKVTPKPLFCSKYSPIAEEKRVRCISRPAHRTPNFTNPKYPKCYFLSIFTG